MRRCDTMGRHKGKPRIGQQRVDRKWPAGAESLFSWKGRGDWTCIWATVPRSWSFWFENSPYVYHSTGLIASNFLRSLGVPCLLYIDDRHNGQLQVSLDKGQYNTLDFIDERNLAAAKSAVFRIAFHFDMPRIFPCFIKVHLSSPQDGPLSRFPDKTPVAKVSAWFHKRSKSL